MIFFQNKNSIFWIQIKMIYNNFSIISIKLKLFPPKFETKLKSDIHMQSLIINLLHTTI